ncbi:LysR family transcriptional regulator [Roseomonas sp. OT10]|uniref:LysR family transcriptional regulator n=1 Tax=Roseomonas cutis TaxID=2897332 RepID=UPI001E37A78A|nr:LysR family transcriptional regulator [Roseomonas sp. OT10]UFN50874.1 LysR family transcriptional regulator [Roseomonas sp. OT10]
MDRIDLFRTFVRVVECGSFTRAADTLRLPRSSVSAAIQALEVRLGARLLRRTTRHVSPTDEGHAFYARCTRLLADVEEAEGLFRQGGAPLTGRLRVDVPARLGRLILAPALPGFFARHPGIELEMGVTDRPVDLLQEGVDCAVRVGPLGDSSLVARRIGVLPLINVASPAYLDRYGTPRDPSALPAHRAVGYASPATGRAEPWEYESGGVLRSLALPRQVTVNNAESYIACCLAGLGLIQIPAYDVQAHLAAGELVEVLPEHRAPPLPIAFVMPHRPHRSRRLLAFLDWVEEVLAARVLSPAPAEVSRPARPG